jgi:hypothetical protein
MPRHQSSEQKKTIERVMHEFKHGELPRGRGGKVKNRKQAVAIALHEAGASKYESPQKNRENLAHQGKGAARPDRRQALGRQRTDPRAALRAGQAPQDPRPLEDEQEPAPTRPARVRRMSSRRQPGASFAVETRLRRYDGERAI